MLLNVNDIELGGWVVGMAVLVFAVVSVGIVLLLKSSHVKRENQKLLQTIQELMDKLARIEDPWPANTPEEDASDMSEDRRRFLQMDREVEAGRLYTLPDISRDVLSGYMGVDRNEFARIIREQSGSRNMREYLNRKRMAYVVEMMKAHPNYTLEAIAKDCGIGSISTFNRVFKEIFGVSPSEYRNNLIPNASVSKED